MPPINWDAVVAIIAVLALVQPWAIAAYKRYFRPGQIEMYETGRIEVGFESTGGTIALQGTLRALDRDQFVKAMEVEVVRERDQAHYRFEWAAFRPTTFGVEARLTLELASGFMLSTSAARRYNVVFIDMPLYDQIRSRLDALSRAFGEQFQTDPAHRELLTRATAVPVDRAAGEQLQEARRRFYEEVFSRGSMVAEVHGELQPLCYWAEGNYKVTLRVQTSSPDKNFSRTWKFQLESRDAHNLRMNVLNMIESALGLSARFPVFTGHVRYIV